MTASVLDDIPGLGPARRKRLLTELGGLKGVKAAPVESLLDLPWLPDKVGQGVFDRIHQPTPASAASRG
jgi:excinuclease ABC subunit C